MTNSAPFFPRMLSASEYVLSLHLPQDRVAVLVRNRTRKQTLQRILAAEAIASPLFLYWLNEQNQGGADIFLGMNPIKDNSYNRTKENIREVRHLYLDLDEGATASLQAIRTSGDIPTPNFVLDTSREKHQVIWRVDGLNQDQAESVLRSLATAFRGDIAATDITRVLRLPGFVNRKYNDHFLVRALQETDQIYHLRDFAAYQDSPDAPRHRGDDSGPTQKMPLGHRSQSEADWAYAKRALARGDAAEEVIRKIADYRAEDKADPDYYARLTVTKAQAELRRQTVSSERAVPRDPSPPPRPPDFEPIDRDRTRL
ncbi:MAG: DNA-primase RepB domain-containing protein [Candidatus Acidiferrales bacterium]